MCGTAFRATDSSGRFPAICRFVPDFSGGNAPSCFDLSLASIPWTFGSGKKDSRSGEAHPDLLGRPPEHGQELALKRAHFHAAGLNAGRWDYIFSMIKKLHTRGDMILPDRAQVTMAVPFMRAYQQLLVRTCHARGAHAIGGMSAFIPNRRQPEVTENALARVREDKQREAGDGSDGTWVAHPDLVPVARAVFDAVLGDRPNQKDRLRDDVQPSAEHLLDTHVDGGRVTEAGVATNVGVALQYLASWLGGNGAAAINNLMEDAATAEISRSQLWQWRVHRVTLDDGRPVTAELYAGIRDAELATLRASAPDAPWTDAAALLDDLVLADEFAEFLTLAAYPLLG